MNEIVTIAVLVMLSGVTSVLVASLTTSFKLKREYKLEELVNDMMESDLKLMTKDQYLKDGGYITMNYFE